MSPEMNLDFAAIVPIGLVSVGAMLVLLGEVYLSRRPTFLGRAVTEIWIGTALAGVATAVLAITAWAAGSGFLADTAPVFNLDNPMIRLDRLANFATVVIAGGAMLAVWLSIAYLVELRINHGEYYALLLVATAGMLLMVSAVDLITIFLGLEIMSIPIYVLAGFDRRKLHSNESSLKYFLVGAFASAIMLYGMAFLYGNTGHTNLDEIRAAIDPTNPLAITGLALVVVGFAFKISSVPFHQWTPDVYEGAPTSITAYMSVTVKTAAFVTLLRFLVTAVDVSEVPLNQVLWVLAALTMIVGNVTAIVQDNVKRMLAYSSIAHAGYILVGFVTANPEGYAAVLFYLFVYALMNLGAFGVIVALADHGRDYDHIEDFAGLARARPGLAAAMTLFMVSLAGIPGTAGFVAKFTIFAAAIRADVIWLTIIAVLTSAISIYYYLRLPVMMYMREPGGAGHRAETPTAALAALVVCAAGVLFFGFLPNWAPALLGRLGALSWARESIALLF